MNDPARVESAAAVTVTVNGQPEELRVAPRRTLLASLREDLHMTGTKEGCGVGTCGACTVLVDGAAVRSCLMFAVQADGADIVTVEGLTPPGGGLTPVQQAFREEHGLQCGFCTPGFVVSVTAYLRDNPAPSDAELRDALSGNLCRCTGYQGIIAAARRAARDLAGEQQ